MFKTTDWPLAAAFKRCGTFPKYMAKITSSDNKLAQAKQACDTTTVAMVHYKGEINVR